MSKKICVFCSASGSLNPVYYDAADALGLALAHGGYDLVYGGSRSGMMGRTADGALKGGANVTGVIPDFLVHKEIAHDDIHTLHVTKTMHERQMKMGELADGFVVMPGGMGTLAEFFEVVTWRTLEVFEKPIILVNEGGFWDHLIAMMQKLEDEGFLHKNAGRVFAVVEDVSCVVPLLDTLFGVQETGTKP